MSVHVPVLLAETLTVLDPQPGETFVDCTVGGGGHAAAIAAALGPGGRLIGIDRDPAALEAAAKRLAGVEARVTLCREDFSRLGAVLERLGVRCVDGILADLGLSSIQLDAAERGFSYQLDSPLDMRMDPAQPLTAADLVNRASAQELAQILSTYGEERFAGRIARFIVERRRRRPLTTTGELVAAVVDAIPAKARRGGGHPARRTFQALRIAVNRELEALHRLLAEGPERLCPGGRMAVISFHSLEDRAVKGAWQALATGCICPPDLPVCRCGRSPRARVLTRRPIRPSAAEIAENPRSRSARLRAIRRVLSAKETE